MILGHSLIRCLQRYVFSTDNSRIFGADLDGSDPFSAVFYNDLRGSYPRSLDRELSVVRDLSPRAVIIDIGTTALSRATVDHVIVSVVSSSSVRSGRTHIDVSLFCLYSVPLCTHTVVLTLMSFSCLYGVPLVYARGRTHIDRALAWLRGVPFMFSTLIFVVLFVWCTVVYAHGRTYIDVSFSCLYGVPLVYARGRTHIDRAFTWCTIYVLHTHSVSSCLYGVPLCTHTVVLTLTCPSLVCMVYH